MNSLKEKLIKKQKIAGTHVRLLDPAVTEMMSNLDFDFLWIDMEHSAIDYGALQSHLIAGREGLPRWCGCRGTTRFLLSESWIWAPTASCSQW